MYLCLLDELSLRVVQLTYANEVELVGGFKYLGIIASVNHIVDCIGVVGNEHTVNDHRVVGVNAVGAIVATALLTTSVVLR